MPAERLSNSREVCLLHSPHPLSRPSRKVENSVSFSCLKNGAEYFQFAEKYPNKKCGVFGEFCHPVADLDKSISFWQKIGFTLKGKMDAPYPHAIMSDGLMIIGLHQTQNFNYPVVTYFGVNTAQRIEELKQQGLRNFNEVMGKNNQSLTTFEGQHFFLFNMGM